MRKNFLGIILIIFFLVPLCTSASAIDDLNQQISEKQREMKLLEDKIELYKKDIEAKQNESVTLSNQLALIKSRTTKIEMDIRMSEAQMATLDIEINSLSNIIIQKEEKISRDKIYVSTLLRSIHLEDQQDYLSVILQNPSFSEYFNHLKYLSDINGQVEQLLKQIKEEKNDLENKRTVANVKKDKLVELKKILTNQKASLSEQKQTQNYLLAQTKMSESKFRLLLEQVRNDYAAVDSQIASLQKKIEKQLIHDTGKLDSQSSVLSWPADPIKGISVYFHDTTYPFRYLFEHSGIDLPIPPRTPLKASASGYVAWVRNSQSYGNNIMIIHNDGIATLYAHLSRFNTSEGAFVSRGDIIGYSGGTPGTPGAGFSTGPHLHFEVRLNGLPTDPMEYLK